jgi:hypothetical protein
LLHHRDLAANFFVRFGELQMPVEYDTAQKVLHMIEGPVAKVRTQKDQNSPPST